MNNYNENPSPLLQYSVIVLFILISWGALVWFALFCISTIEQIVIHPSDITINESRFCMLGIAIGLGALTYACGLETIKKQPVPNDVLKIVLRVALLGFLLAFLLPDIIHYPMSCYLETKGYKVCTQASYRRKNYRTVVYTIPGMCKKTGFKRNSEIWSSGH